MINTEVGPMVLGSVAVVLGGSVGGLCSAGALAPHFDHVVVLERDELPADAQHRRGVPQSKHPHFLLNSGRRAIGELFPGFEDELIAAGGLHLMPSMDAAYLDGEGWSARKSSAMTMIYSSRILIERVLRDKIRSLSNVELREGVAVHGLSVHDGAVTGVQISTSAGDERIDADFVVDAMGRGSSVGDWLVAAGWPAPPVQTLDAKVTYTSRWYDLPSAEQRPSSWWWQHLVIMPTPDKGQHPAEHDFLVNFFPVEDNRVIACMGSWGHPMPRSTEAFLESARRVRTPLFASAMDRCTPTSQVHLTRSTGNKWRRYDRWSTPPKGLVFVGDSICAFNPFYAQGISSAASSALLLREHLSRAGSVDRRFCAGFLAEQRKLLGVPWRLAMARDQGYECAVGTEQLPEWKRRILAAVSGPAFSLIVGAAREDAVVDEHFSKVFNLDESLGQMMTSPRVLAGLVRYRIRAALGRERVPYGFDPQAEPPATDYSSADTARTAARTGTQV
ncbi:2-polyprenyl-6-methoxyphenol hydroxylase-like FAD-dependent oxidoreductase [Prauserella sediminis]|uniref:2-polyprenyl-6-methoxyphenol hydroxylase-like FAD-dependent oxidoreductase n=2 Tax=Prauserella salsuginis group TaxID=2893672 RepID=A0A839XUA9_9PSEU|nr:2-polyprenyl-6-methoxyphenol hydroxylase-like FAD-dependent oxidoreductase [Prauserella sediminis]